MTKEVAAIINCFAAEDRFNIAKRGWVYTGPAPFGFDNGRDKLRDDGPFSGPWVIQHPLADHEVFYRVIGVECWAIHHISKGTSIGLLVEPITFESIGTETV